MELPNRSQRRIFLGFLGCIGVFLALSAFGPIVIHTDAVTSAVTGQTQTSNVQIGVLEAFFIALFYYLSNSPFLANLGFTAFTRPLIAGLVVGIILGDPLKGAMIGAAINVLYLGFISAGGSQPSDPALAGANPTMLHFDAM